MSPKQNFLSEIIISIILIALLVLICEPFELFMPGRALMSVIVVLIILFATYAIFVWKHQPHDEREEAHYNLAGKLAFLIGSSVLVIAIITQSFRHELDLWLIYALISMIITKIFGLIYSQLKK